MNMKKSGWGVEIWKSAVGANGAQTCTVMETKLTYTTPYIAVNSNFRKFGGIFRHGADVALMQGAHQHEAKRMES